MNKKHKFILGSVIALIVLSLGLIYASTSQARAADLGGNCCADLEDRIAELEATTARKGNRKISVTVYGVVNEGIYHVSGDGIAGKWAVGPNSNDPSLVGIRGVAVIAPQVTAGYVLEIGVGSQRDTSFLGAIGSPFAYDSSETYTNRSFGYVSHEKLGTVSVGLNYQATHEISQISTANTQVAARMWSFRPLVGPQMGEALDLFDGSRANMVRYDSAELYGLKLSASWAAGGIDGMSTGDVWDVALRWQGEFSGFEARAGIGYREGIAIPGLGALGSVSMFGTDIVDPNVLSGSASIKHTASGLFVNGMAGRLDLGGVLGDSIGDITAWAIQAGDERKLLPIGMTTFYGEYGDSDVGNFNFGLSYWGIGAVQHIDAAAADLYASYRVYDLEAANVDYFGGGLRIQF